MDGRDAILRLGWSVFSEVSRAKAKAMSKRPMSSFYDDWVTPA
jgi:hypothetical protein